MAADSPPSRSGSNYDRGQTQAAAFAAVLNRWNPLQTDGRHKFRAISNSHVAGRISRHLARTYWPNDVQRAYDGELRMHHLKPEVVEGYCVALERTDDDSMAEAFAAIELLPPVVTKGPLKLAIATARSSSGRLTA